MPFFWGGRGTPARGSKPRENDPPQHASDKWHRVVPGDDPHRLATQRPGEPTQERDAGGPRGRDVVPRLAPASARAGLTHAGARDRKSTRLNSSHLVISYAVFCLKKKKTTKTVRHE